MKKLKFTTGIPPLMLIGTIIVLFPIFTYMTIDRINKQKAQSIRLLVEKSTALIRAFEAGTYTGMMNMGWNQDIMEVLLSETAALPDISYLFIVNKSGQILAHNKKNRAGLIYKTNLDLSEIIKAKKIGWRTIKSDNDKKVFEVYKNFSPIDPRKETPNLPMTMHQKMHVNATLYADEYENTVIFVGLDMELVTQADKGDTQHSIMMAIILALIGLTGFILVFIVQRYAVTKSSLSRIQIFSDTLVENMPVGLIATDMNNRIISVNPAAKKNLNIQQNYLTRDLDALLPSEIRSLLQIKDIEQGLIEKEIQIDDGVNQLLNLEIIASPLNDKNEGSLGTLLILRDKTEFNLLKSEMEQNKRLAAIGRLAAGVAHEIRNPLSSLKGYATFFKEIFEKDSENYDIADVMTKEVDRLNRVVSELVELAKPVAVSGNPVDLHSLILESAQLITYEPDIGNIKIKTDIEENIPPIQADADRLKQVVLNLSLNAIQAMEGSGTLDLTLFKVPNEEMVSLIISDTGKGISQEDLPNIFEPYFTTKLSGTGLGLAIVHSIIKAHQGNIKATSELDKGSRFLINLPIRSS